MASSSLRLDADPTVVDLSTTRSEDPVQAGRRATQAAMARAASARRRPADPATCRRDHPAARRDFVRTMEGSSRQSGRLFPAGSEVLEVFEDLASRMPS